MQTANTRLMAILLSLAMIFTVLPMAAFANGDPATDPTETTAETTKPVSEEGSETESESSEAAKEDPTEGESTDPAAETTEATEATAPTEAAVAAASITPRAIEGNIIIGQEIGVSLLESHNNPGGTTPCECTYDHPDEGWAWDADTNTLTLNGYSGGGIWIGGSTTDEVTIELVNNSTIDSTINGATNGIESTGSLRFDGSGELNVTGADNGISVAQREIVIDGGTIRATGTAGDGITTSDKVIITDGSVTAKGNLYGINSRLGVEVSGSSTLTVGDSLSNGNVQGDLIVTGENAVVNVNGSVNGSLTVSGGEVKIVGEVSDQTTVTDGDVEVDGERIVPIGSGTISGELYINGVEVIPDLTKSDSDPAAGWAWDAPSATLTLNGYSGGGISINCAPTDEIKLVIAGASEIAATGTQGIFCGGSLAISGGTIEITTDSQFGILSGGSLSISGATVVAEGVNAGLNAPDIAISDGANVTATASSGSGVDTNSVTVDNATLVVGEAGNPEASAIVGDVTVTGSSSVVTVYGDVFNNLTVEGGTVTVTVSVYENLTVEGGDVTVSTVYEGLTVTGGTVVVENEVLGDLDISGGDVTVGGVTRGSITGSLWINGEEVIPDLSVGDDDPDAGWSWDVANAILTLDGYSGGGIQIFCDPDDEINLKIAEGTSSIENPSYHGIQCAGSLVIGGSGELVISVAVGNSSGIYADGGVTIGSGTFSISAEDTLSASGTYNNAGVYGGSGVVINGGSGTIKGGIYAVASGSGGTVTNTVPVLGNDGAGYTVEAAPGSYTNPEDGNEYSTFLDAETGLTILTDIQFKAPPAPPSQPKPSAPRPSPSSGHGRDSSDSGPVYKQPVADDWLDPEDARPLAANAKRQSLDYARTLRTGSYGVRGKSWAELKGLRFYHDTTLGGAVQVRVTFDNPALFSEDARVSGYVSGAAADGIRATFEKWFTNPVRTIHFDQAGAWENPVLVAAKLDFTGLDTTKLYFYSFDPKTGTYRRIAAPKYWIDANGYVHFTTELAGEIVVTEGPLEKR